MLISYLVCIVGIRSGKVWRLDPHPHSRPLGRRLPRHRGWSAVFRWSSIGNTAVFRRLITIREGNAAVQIGYRTTIIGMIVSSCSSIENAAVFKRRITINRIGVSRVSIGNIAVLIEDRITIIIKGIIIIESDVSRLFSNAVHIEDRITIIRGMGVTGLFSIAVHFQRITITSVAPGVGVTHQVRRAAALGPVVDGLTVGALATGSPGADVLTPVADQVTFLGGLALQVTLALDIIAAIFSLWGPTADLGLELSHQGQFGFSV